MKYSAAGEGLVSFAERYDIPFAETQAGKGTVVSSHPLNVGGVGETGCLAANLLAKEADLVIGIGTRFSDFTTSSKWIFQSPCVRFLNVNVSNFDAWKLDGIPMLADAARRKRAQRCAGERVLAGRMGRADCKRAEPADERDPARLSGGLAGKGFRTRN